MRQVLLILAVFAFSACATYVQHSTPSGKPEVTIHSSRERIKNAIVNTMIDNGFIVSGTDDLLLSFDKPLKDDAVIVLIGPKPDTPHNLRVSFNLVPVKSGTRVVADTAVILFAGTGQQRRQDLNNRAETMKVQTYLDDAKRALEH